MKIKIFLIIFILPILVFGQDSKNYNTIDLSATLHIDPSLHKISGEVVYILIPTKNSDKIYIDAPGLHIKKVKKGWFNQKYKSLSNSLVIYKKFKKGKKYRFKIKYEAYPKKAMYFVGWEHPSARKQIWTQGQGKGNAHWIPLNEDQNDKFTWVLNISFDKNYRVVSNGLLENKKKINDSLTRWIYRQTQKSPGYLMFVGIGKYKQDSVISSTNKLIYNYRYPDKIKNDKTFYKTRDIFDFIEKEIGLNYPWINYKQIPLRDFLYGGMENVSVSSFNGNRYVVDSVGFNDQNFVNVSAHELVHQWFGDLVTGKTSSDHWIHEGFATYYARLNDAKIFGKDYNDYQILKYDQQIINAAKKDTIPIHRPNASSLSYYQKGARVVQMLREKTGDSIFKNSIKSFLSHHKFQNVEIKDLQHEFFKQSGDSLNPFFHFWLDSTKIPTLKMVHKKDSIVFIKNEIPQPIPFLFIYRDTIIKKKISNSFGIPNAKNLISLIPNTDNAVLANIEFQSNEKWIENQVLKSPYFSDKYLGIKQLKDHSKKDSIFKILLERKEFYPLYNEIINYAIQTKNSLMLSKLFKKGLKTRQNLAIKMNRIPRDFKKEYKQLLLDSSYITKEVALWHYIKNFPEEKRKVLQETRHIKGGNDHSFRLTWLTLYLITPDLPINYRQKYLNELINYTSPTFNMETRLNAFRALLALQYFNDTALQNLMDASLHFNWHLHKPARNLLKKLYLQKHYKSLILSLLKNRDTKEQSFLKKLLNIN